MIWQTHKKFQEGLIPNIAIRCSSDHPPIFLLVLIEDLPLGRLYFLSMKRAVLNTTEKLCNELTDEGLHLSVIAFNNLVKYMNGEI